MSKMGVVHGLEAQLHVEWGRLEEAKDSLSEALAIASQENDWCVAASRH